MVQWGISLSESPSLWWHPVAWPSGPPLRGTRELQVVHTGVHRGVDEEGVGLLADHGQPGVQIGQSSRGKDPQPVTNWMNACRGGQVHVWGRDCATEQFPNECLMV